MFFRVPKTVFALPILFFALYHDHFSYHLYKLRGIGVEDGGAGGTCPGRGARAPLKFGKKIFSDNYYVKFGHFSGKNHVKFGNFVNFSGKYHTSSVILIIFRAIIM